MTESVDSLKERKLLACRNYPIVYAEISKSACTTIKNLLYELDTGEAYSVPDSIHSHRTALLSRAPEDRNEFDAALARATVRFTFVRDPARRIYSTYSQKILYPPSAPFRSAREVLARDFAVTIRDEPLGASLEEHRENFRRFLLFIRANVNGETALPINRHWISQSAAVEAYRRDIDLDFIGRVENFAADMAHVLRLARVEHKLNLGARYNEGPPVRYSFDQTISKESCALIREIYTRDFEEFGYPYPESQR